MKKHLKLTHCTNKFDVHIERESSKVKSERTGNLECTHCNQTFFRKLELADHMESHAAAKKYSCHICNKDYAREQYLKAHLLLHEETPIKNKSNLVVDTGDCSLDEWNDFIKRRVKVCPICNKDYRTPRNMRKHLRRVHTSERKYGCDECGKTFKSRDSQNMHIKIKHQGRKIKKDYNYECYYCGAKYINKYTLSDHISSHTGIPNHVCKICNKGYACAASLKVHNIKSHLQFTGVPIEKFKCDLCEKEFFEKKKLNKHKAWAHGDKFHLCKVCGAKIKGSLKQHMVTHTGERKYCCHICGKKLRGKLKEHMLTHTGDRPYACEVCGGTFRNKWYLTVHMRSHNGIRPYTCEFCGQKFAARSCYTAHLKKHETKKKKPDPQNHQCQLCRSSFPTEETLNEHIRKHFGV